MKKLQLDKLIGFIVTIALPGYVVFKLGATILENATRRQVAINVTVVEALVVFIIVRLAIAMGMLRRKS